MAAGWPLVGRGEELDLLEASVAGEQRRSVVVAGAIGVGKSRLVADFLGRIAAEGVRVVTARATRSTATIPFGPFAPWAPDHTATGAGAAAGATTDRLQLFRAIGGQLLQGGDRVVVAVDDAHLLDEGSAALVLHLVVHTPASVVVTVRSGEPCPDAVVALWKEGLAERAELQSLSEPETVELVERVLDGPLAPAARQRLWSLTNGTPLYLREVVRAAIDQGVLGRDPGDPRGTWRWRGKLAGSVRLAELIGDHLAQAGPGERRVLELVALGEPLPLELVSELDPEGALAAAEQRGFVVVEAVPDRPAVRLAHPLYGEVLRAGVPALAAQERQRELAAAALTVGWQDRDPLRVASWWLNSGTVTGDPDVFLAAANQATSLTEWELAGRLAHAAERSGAGAAAALTRAASLLPLERWDEADELLAGVSVTATDDDISSEAARLRAALLFWRRGDAAAAIDVDLGAAARLPAPSRARVLAHAGFVALFSFDPVRADRLATEAMNDAGPVLGLRVQALSVATLSWAVQGRVSATLVGAEMGLPHLPAAIAADLYRGASMGEVSAVMPVAYCLALSLDGRIADAVAIADAALELAQHDDARLFRALVATLAGRVALFQGRPGVARRLGLESLSILREAGAHPPSQWPAAVLATGAAQVGDAATAEEAIEWAATSGPPVPLYALELTIARAWLAAARGELSAARALAGEVAAAAAAAGAWAYEATSLLEVARFGAPEAVADRLGELTALVEGAYVPLAAEHARALAAGDGDGLDLVSAGWEGIGAILLATEAAAGAAGVHQAAGRKGSQLGSLNRARVLVAACDGARTPALRDLDADPILGTLTDREREVVELAARGLTNREVAASLYVSMRTVNTHLYRAYAKLGVGDRSQLAAVLAAGGAGVGGPSGPGAETQ